VEAVLSQWEAASPFGMLQTKDGLARARKLSARVFLTTGEKDEAELFEPSARFAQALTDAGIERVWAPTPLGHTGALRERWEPMLRFFLQQAPTR
jgi:enterochelin esterase-like enzyme